MFLATCDDDADCPVVLNNFVMCREVGLGFKLSNNIFAVTPEFALSMGEEEANGGDCAIPGRNPIRLCADMLLRLRDCKAKLFASKGSRSLFIKCDTVDRREDNVEINGFSSEDSLPLQSGESARFPFSSELEKLPRTTGVASEYCQDTAGFFALGIKLGFGRWFKVET